MERLFATHEIRKSTVCSPVWTLTTLDAGGLQRPEKVVVPSVWESDPRLRAYRGRGAYEQKIRCGGNVRIWLAGVSFQSKVYLDGVFLGEHYGAYTGFEVLARNIAYGEHSLRVETDNRFGSHSALHVPNDYYAYGGINRPVIVEELGSAYITSLHVTTVSSNGQWTARVETSVRCLADELQNVEISVRLAGQAVSKDLHLSGSGTETVSFDIPCPDVRAWSPDDPVLYTVTAVLAVNGKPADDLIDRAGFRTVQVSGKQILLNGQPLRLKGFNRHEEYGSFGLSAPLEAMMQDIQLMRDLGANCVRTCHYPNDPRFLDLCDETGLLVWEESHVRGFQEDKMRHPRFMEQLRLSTEEMVDQHFNHPAIFVWGCLNECADDTEYGIACYREIFNLLRKLDPGRPVTAALLERPGGKAYGYMDVVSINIYPRWYHDDPVTDSLDSKLHESDMNGGAGKPVIVSEIGAGAIYGYHDPFGNAKWSEERQCLILKEQIEAVLRHPDITGVFLWQLADVRVDEEWAIHRPKTYNNKGVVDEYRRPKLAYQTVKELFHLL